MESSRVTRLIFLAVVLAGCATKATLHVTTSTPHPPPLVTVARLDPKDFSKAMASLGRHDITVMTESNNPPRPGILVDPNDEKAARRILAEDSKAKGYKLYDFKPATP